MHTYINTYKTVCMHAHSSPINTYIHIYLHAAMHARSSVSKHAQARIHAPTTVDQQKHMLYRNGIIGGLPHRKSKNFPMSAGVQQNKYSPYDTCNILIYDYSTIFC